MIRVSAYPYWGSGLGAEKDKDPKANPCPDGYFSAVVCQADERRETHASGCQRCVKKTEAEKSSPNCIRSIQMYFVQKGMLTLASANGTLNDKTKKLLAGQFGDDWQDHPGGVCAMMASIGAGEILASGLITGGGSRPTAGSTSFGPIKDVPSWAIPAGIGALVLILILSRK